MRGKHISNGLLICHTGAHKTIPLDPASAVCSGRCVRTDLPPPSPLHPCASLEESHPQSPPIHLYPGHSPTISLRAHSRISGTSFGWCWDSSGGLQKEIMVARSGCGWGVIGMPGDNANAVPDFWRSASAFGTRTTSPPHCLGEGRLGAEHLFQHAKPSSSPTHWV